MADNTTYTTGQKVTAGVAVAIALLGVLAMVFGGVFKTACEAYKECAVTLPNGDTAKVIPMVVSTTDVDGNPVSGSIAISVTTVTPTSL